MNLHIIVHGKSAANPDLRQAVAGIRRQGHKVTVRPTWEGGDAGILAQRAVLESADVVIAGGGDGTVNEVAMGMVTSRPGPAGMPSFGILPLGTANDLARSAGIPLDLSAALELIVSGDARLVDLGRIGDRIFLNVATGGFGTQVTVETPEAMKKALGGAAYLLTGLTRYSSIGSARARFTGPGFNWEGDFLVLAIGNGRQAGGGHVLCPEATLDDGLLDLRILPDVPRSEMGQAVKELLSSGLDAVERTVVTARLPEFEISADQDICINLDGEPISGRHFKVQVMPTALALHLPADTPLL
jgi:lipid kinase YegS